MTALLQHSCKKNIAYSARNEILSSAVTGQAPQRAG